MTVHCSNYLKKSKVFSNVSFDGSNLTQHIKCISGDHAIVGKYISNNDYKLYITSPPLILLPVGSAILTRVYPTSVADMKFLVVIVALFSAVQSRPQVASRTNVCKSSVCEDNSVVDMVTMTPALSSLAAAVGAAELVDTLASQGTILRLKRHHLQLLFRKMALFLDGKFTVFAPVDKAFEAIPDLGAVLEDKEALTAILLRYF